MAKFIEEKEEEEPVMEMVQLFTEEKEEKEDLDNSMEEGIIEVSEKESEEEEKNEQPEEVKENESNGETTKTANASKKSNTKQKNIQSKENKTVSHTDILNKIDEKIKDIGKNLELKNLNKFLDENIFKIEKLLGKFINNICNFFKLIKSNNSKK